MGGLFQRFSLQFPTKIMCFLFSVITKRHVKTGCRIQCTSCSTPAGFTPLLQMEIFSQKLKEVSTVLMCFQANSIHSSDKPWRAIEGHNLYHRLRKTCLIFLLPLWTKYYWIANRNDIFHFL